MKTFIVVVALAAFAVYWFGFRGSACGKAGALACPDASLEEGVGSTLNGIAVCPAAGYLCYERKRPFQVARWALDKGKLRVRVTSPDFLSAAAARQVRDAAVEGIMVWDGHPFPIVMDTAEFTVRMWDVRVTWTEGLFNAAAGLNRFGWDIDGKRIVWSVGGLTVVVPPEVRLAGSLDGEMLARVTAVATHEMGHALGLAHSDAEGDIMFPELRPPAARLHASARDFKTIDALYSLPNGAMME